MELKEFIKKVIADAIEAVDESSDVATRGVYLASRNDKRTIEFDVAVSVEETKSVQGKAGIKVLSFMEGRGELGSGSKNSKVSRIVFGVDVNSSTKAEMATERARMDRNALNSRRNEFAM